MCRSISKKARKKKTTKLNNISKLLRSFQQTRKKVIHHKINQIQALKRSLKVESYLNHLRYKNTVFLNNNTSKLLDAINNNSISGVGSQKRAGGPSGPEAEALLLPETQVSAGVVAGDVFLEGGFSSNNSNSLTTAQGEPPIPAESALVIDSGTSLHIVRDKSEFEHLTDQTINIKGVTGVSVGTVGFLRDSVLGKNIKAIYFPGLPVAALISVRGLKSANWMVCFGRPEKGDYLLHFPTGTFVSLTSTNTGLPSLKALTLANSTTSFKSEDGETGLVCTPIGGEPGDFESYNSQELLSSVPRHLRSSIKQTLPRAHRKRGPGADPRQKLLNHWRFCHIHDSSDTRNNCRCVTCLENKFKALGSDNIASNAETRTESPLFLLSADFFGPVRPDSFRGSRFVLVYVCNTTGWISVRCVKNKSDVVVATESLIREVRSKMGVDIKTGRSNRDLSMEIVLGGLRTDNEPVLRSSEFCEMLERHNIRLSESIPYMPWTNSVAERAVGSLKNNLRCTMADVDPRVWDYGIKAVVSAWNLLPRFDKSTKTKRPPQETINQTTDNPLCRVNVERKKKFLRRFGCLAIFRPGRTEQTKIEDKNKVLSPRALRGINLGWSDDKSCWLVGCFPSHISNKFAVYQITNAVFLEDILVSDIRKLNSANSEGPDEAVLRKLEPSVAAEAADAAVGGPQTRGGGASEAPQGRTQELWLGEEAKTRSDNTEFEFLDIEFANNKPKGGRGETETTDTLGIKSMSGSEIYQRYGPDLINTDTNTNPQQKKFEYGPPQENTNTIASDKRGRGRPKGTKDSKLRKRRTNQQLIEEGLKLPMNSGLVSSFITHLDNYDNNNLNASLYSHLDFGPDEVLVHTEVFLSKN